MVSTTDCSMDYHRGIKALTPNEHPRCAPQKPLTALV